MEKIMIIGAGWEQIPMIQKAKKLGLYVIATTWWDVSKIPADKVFSIDSRDLNSLEKIFLEENPNYVIADECDYSMYAVAFLSEKYNLPGPSLKIQTITNNKFLQRETIKNSSICQPEYQLCAGIDDVYHFLDKVGYPIIIKPLDNRGSIGVSKVHDEEQIKSAYLSAIENSHSRLCLAERCIDGEVITADVFCDTEGCEFIAASSKEMYTDNDNVAKVLYYPGKFTDSLYREIKKNAETVVSVVGLEFGFAHIEFIVEKGTEQLYLVEVANRGGGVFISNIVLEQITGLDYCTALIQMAMGQKVNIRCNQKYSKKTIMYFVSLNGEKEIGSCSQIADEVQAIFINSKLQLKNVDEVASAGRQGVLILSGDNAEDLKKIGSQFENEYGIGTKEFMYFKEV